MSVAVLALAPESVFEIGKRLTELLMQEEADSDGDSLADSARERIGNVTEALRTRVIRRRERDLRSLFDLDEELIELMDRVEDATAYGREVPAELLQEVNDYLEAFERKSIGSPAIGGGRNRSPKSALKRQSGSRHVERPQQGDSNA
jgi:hypothetical protein